MRAGLIIAMTGVALTVQPASGQRLLEEWRSRTSAGAEALARGPDAVFWNPALVRVEAGRVEASIVDLRAPRETGVDGLSLAAALALDGGRTTLAFGYEHVGVGGIEGTTTSPEPGAPIDVAENRFAFAASHMLGGRARAGALVQYTRLPEITGDDGVMAIGAGLYWQPVERWPVHIAGMAASEGREAYWLAGLEYAAPWRVHDWRFRGEYGLAGGELAPGVTHRLAASGDWRQAVELAAGLAVEPDADGRRVVPVGSATLRLARYRLGVVREQLTNGFGAAYSFRFGVSF